MQMQSTSYSGIAVLVPLLSGITGALVTLIGNHFYSRWKDKKEKREKIFKTLMSTRGFRAYPAHVEALCAVEVEWSASDDTTVHSAWKAYNYHLNKQVPDDVNNSENIAWRNDLEELFANLIVALGESIGKPQDKTEVKRGAYGPKSWWDAEFEANLLRKGLLSIIGQGRGLSIPVSVSYDQVVQQQLNTIALKSKFVKAGE
jgi:hypothetical protein